MRKKLLRLLVTGGAGFIGSSFVKNAVSEGYCVAVVDKLTYAADLERLKGVRSTITFYKADICDAKAITRIFKKESPQAVVHFAAESHVDRSIVDASSFLSTNISGTHLLLDASRSCGVERFLHISTDEVYGEIRQGSFNEGAKLNPGSPYAASKAAADLLIQSYIRTYAFPAIIIRPSNNYGPWQYPEKFIPLACVRLLRNEKIPVYAKGRNKREWLYVEDCVKAILAILEKGSIGEIYNVGSQEEKANIDMVKMLLAAASCKSGMYEFVPDRPGHDFRYSLNSMKIRRQIGWKPQVKLELGLTLTSAWCFEHKRWLFSKWHQITKLYPRLKSTGAKKTLALA